MNSSLNQNMTNLSAILSCLLTGPETIIRWADLDSGELGTNHMYEQFGIRSNCEIQKVNLFGYIEAN